MKQVAVTVGILAHNEEQNIEKAILSVQGSVLETARIVRIIVVSSGSNDRTNRLVLKMQKKDKRIILFSEAERKGKSAAINLFLKNAKAQVVVTLSADLRLSKKALDEVCHFFLNPEVGMVGAHPVPTNTRFSKVGEEIKLLWELHHEISLIQPKCGEMVAFRNVMREIPADSAVDEATIEVLLKLLGYAVVYAPKAIVYNKGPKTVAEFLCQRRRVQAGHQWVFTKYNYRVVTLEPTHTITVVLKYLWGDPRRLLPMTRLVLLELLARLLGWMDFHVMGKNPYVWKMVRR